MTQKRIKFFKVIYAFCPDWTLQEAAYLACGKKPTRKKPLLQKHKTQVRHLHNRFVSYFEENKIKPTYQPAVPTALRLTFNKDYIKQYERDKRDLYDRYSTIHYLSVLKKSGFKYDPDIESALSWAGGSLFERSDNKAQYDEDFYVGASEILTGIYGPIPNRQMIEILIRLVKKLNKKFDIYMPIKKEATIERYLKGNSSVKAGRPKKDTPPIKIEWKLVLSKFKP